MGRHVKASRSYLGGVLGHVAPSGHLLTCVVMWFYRHCPGQGRQACQTFCRGLWQEKQQCRAWRLGKGTMPLGVK